MKILQKSAPHLFLEEFRGSDFHGEWPTLPEMFRITVKRFPNRACFTDFLPERSTLSYAQALEKITRLADWLLSQNILKGDKIAVCGKNGTEWAVAYLAVLFAGGIVVPIDFALKECEIENLLKASGAKILFIDEERYEAFKNSENAPRVFSLSDKYEDAYIFNLAADGSRAPHPVEENDTAAILFTSGTMGNPKGVMLSHKNLVSDCYIAQTHLTLYCEDVFYALLPIHHSYTMMAAFIEPMSCGAEIVFGKSMAVSRMLHELKEGRVTMLLGVPLLFNKLLAGIDKGIREKGVFVYGFMKFLMGISYAVKKIFRVNPGKKMFSAVLSKASLSTLRIAICGGGPLAASVFRMYNELGIDFIQGYGLTETSPIIALNPKERFKIKSVGSFFRPYMEMTILNPDENGIGEVAVKGPMVMQGYYNMPEETKAAFTDGGWFKTGDLGWLDNEDYLYLCGRAKNLIVTEGGKNVFPEEIENAFQLFTDVEQITVRGYISDKSTCSESVEALIYPADDLFKRLDVMRGTPESADLVNYTLEEIVAKVNRGLQPYQRISRVTVLNEPLEMTTTKKVKRNAVK